MRLVVFSHKKTWRDPQSSSGYANVGGFPSQMAFLSQIFDETRLFLPIRKTSPPSGSIGLWGNNLSVIPVAEPTGQGWRRKLSMLIWIPRHWRQMWRIVAEADAVHTPVGSDIGLVGIFIALMQRKPLFVRHCGNWLQSVSSVDTFTHWLLEKIAGGQNVVMATGDSDTPPSATNLNIKWIFASSLTKLAWQALPVAKPWRKGEMLRLVTVGRLSPGKNMQAIVEALPGLLEVCHLITLDIVGDGELRRTLQAQVGDLRLTNQVVFHGNVSHQEVLEILGKSHIFVFPTHSEGFPKAMLEAMACGLPVVASPVSVIPNLIGEDRGILLRSLTPQGIVTAVTALIADEEQMARFGKNGREKSKQYTLEHWQSVIAERLEEAWNCQLSKPKAEIKG